MTVVAIHQPNFLPWLGYYHKMLLADVFVLLDHVQFQRAVCRNRVKTPGGELYLTVPVNGSDSHNPITEVRIGGNRDWRKQHLATFQAFYARCPHFRRYADPLQAIYQEPWTHLADLNKRLIFQVKDWLGVKTPVVCSSELDGIEGQKKDLLLSICRRLGATVYLSGRGAAKYNDPAIFERNGIRLVYQEFLHPVYPQPWGAFISSMCALDCLFNCGEGAGDLLRSAGSYSDARPGV